MVKTITSIIFLLCSLSLAAQKKDTKVIFVIADGISADALEKVETPNLDALAKIGGYSHAYVGGKKDGYSETPTISAVGYNSLLTGTWVNKHNVFGNGIKKPNYHYWTIFRYAKEQKPELKTAIYSTWLDNRTKLIGEGLKQTGNVKVDIAFDGYENDTATFPHDKERIFIHNIDELVIEKAVESIKADAPDLSWVYLEYTDDMGHKFGDSEQFENAIKIMDAQIGKLQEAMAYRKDKFDENWEIYITTDHGRDVKTGKNHGGQSDRERSTWIVTNSQNLNEYFKEETPGIVDIMPAMMQSLGLKPSKDQSFEIDGISITNPISVAKAEAEYKDGNITLRWKSYQPKEKLKIYVSVSNKFAEGGIDEYQVMKTVSSADEETTLNVSYMSSKIYKIVIEGKYNTTNTWIVL
ncbi:alkaline phosphatase family protein [Chondrinema litorale]|uniref:alkaline phosphatase family protein n=1 Tax=Chondrinema litorale TaxID=2994555 RepID=UPI002543AF49|nr:alkaline phosphatase family protein [Chondrinema litorale]UZR96535.1 alkaline phosphatase family protein [Chondrinema litorale]